MTYWFKSKKKKKSPPKPKKKKVGLDLFVQIYVHNLAYLTKINICKT